MRTGKPSPALAISLVALFVALGGTSYAVSQIPKASVGAPQLKRGAVTTKKIRDGAVKLRKIDRATWRALTGQRGPAGPSGAPGPQGVPGPPGESATRLYASVGAGCGGIAVGRGAIDVEHPASARCDVRFDRDVSDCLSFASPRQVGPTDSSETVFPISVTVGDQDNTGFTGLQANEVAVIVLKADGDVTIPPMSFKVVVFC